MAQRIDAGRSYTHPLSNVVVLKSLDVSRHIREILDNDLPLDCLPVFLHEATHHWCFNSPVGLAEFFLFCRARRAAFEHIRKSPRAYSSHDWDVYDCVQRYEFVQGLMRPLSEGIALYAEHDASPGRARTISIPMSLVGTFFARGLAVRQGADWEELPTILAGGRLTSPHIRRKADLLIQPLGFGDGGYLPGYLCVKNLWQLNLFHLLSPIFWDTDFYLQFLHSYFYKDWILVARILDDSRSDVGALGPIVDRLQERLVSFATEGGREKLACEFERRTKDGDWATFSLKARLGEGDLEFDPSDCSQEAEVGRQRLQAIFKELFDEWPEDEQLQALVRIDLETLQLRDTISLGHSQFDAQANDNDLEFFVDNRHVFSISRPDVLHKGWSGRLDVDVIVRAMPPGTFIFVTHGEEVVAAHSLGASDVPESLSAHFSNRKDRTKILQMSNEILQSILNDGSIEVARDHARRELSRMIEGIYAPRALAWATDANFASIRKAMEHDGLLPLMNGDLRALADAAAISLCVPLGHLLESVSPFHSWSQEPPFAAASHINSILSEQSQFEPFLVLNSEVKASLI